MQEGQRAHHRLSQEILLKRSFTRRVILQRNIPIRAKSAGQHSDIPKRRFTKSNSWVKPKEIRKEDSQRLIQNIRHLILEILSRNERINQIPPILSLERHDLPTRTPNIRVYIKCLPEMVYRHRTGFGTDIEEDTDSRLENGAKGVEEPTMRVDFLLILFLEAEYDLDGYNALFCALDFEVGVDGDWKEGEHEVNRERGDVL
jgi:hypothetical protein